MQGISLSVIVGFIKDHEPIIIIIISSSSSSSSRSSSIMPHITLLMSI